MNIVILDDIEINDSQLQQLKKYGSVKVFNGVPSNIEEIRLRASEAEIILCGWTKINEKVLDKLPKLRFISLWATGYDNVDIKAASQRGIVVSNVPNYAKDAVAELAISLMLAVTRKITHADKNMKKKLEFNWKLYQGLELREKTLGILGTGAIGCRVAQIAAGFGMKLIAYDPYPRQDIVRKLGLKYVEFNTIFQKSNIVTMHLPLNEVTKNLITSKEFDLMKESSIFINTARAAIVEQDSLYKVLKENRIFGAGLDDIDFSQKSGYDLLTLDNVVATPHIGFNTKEAVTKKTDICISNVIQYLDLNPVNVVSLNDYRGE